MRTCFVDLLTGELRRARGHDALTPTERQLLAYLVARPGVVVEKGELYREVWGYAENTRSRTLDVTWQRMRAKLGEDSEVLQAIRGRGMAYVPSSPFFVAPLPRPGLPERLEHGTLFVGPPGVGKSHVAYWRMMTDADPVLFVDATVASGLWELLDGIERRIGRIEARTPFLLCLDGIDGLWRELAGHPIFAGAVPGLRVVATLRRRVQLKFGRTYEVCVPEGDFPAVRFEGLDRAVERASHALLARSVEERETLRYLIANPDLDLRAMAEERLERVESLIRAALVDKVPGGFLVHGHIRAASAC